MKDTTQFNHKEHKFEFRHWSPELALRMMARLIKICGEPVARAFIGLASEGGGKGLTSVLDKEVDSSAKLQMVSAGIGAFAERLDEEEVVKFVKDAMTEAYCDGKDLQSTYQAVFLGKPGLMLKVIQKQLSHQLSDFLELLPVSSQS